MAQDYLKQKTEYIIIKSLTNVTAKSYKSDFFNT